MTAIFSSDVLLSGCDMEGCTTDITKRDWLGESKTGCKQTPEEIDRREAQREREREREEEIVRNAPVRSER